MVGLGVEREPFVASAVETQLRYDIVIPTVGRPSLRVLLQDLSRALERGHALPPERLILVDDRPAPQTPLLSFEVPAELASLVRVLPGKARGPAAARNLGWRAGSAPWVVFLDDDVRPPELWLEKLCQDLLDVADDIGGSQGRIRVPLPRHRPPTDWERNVAGLERARWATADMAFRRRVLVEVGGFDERFARAYREDADIGLRITEAGWRIRYGGRTIDHPVRPADPFVSLRLQRGNADDALMRALHGPSWRARAGVPRGARPTHLLTTGLTAIALWAALAAATALALVAALFAFASLTRFTWSRIKPGPRTLDEIVTMVLTSPLLPFAATWHYVRGVARGLRHLGRPHVGPLDGKNGEPGEKSTKKAPVRVVCVDRDGTLIEDVPYNKDPALVRPRPRAKEALDRLRAAGLPIVVITNQSGVGRGLLSAAEVDRVNARVEALLGPFDGWYVCPHAPTEGCPCRKPEAGLLLAAAQELDVEPAECVLIGDIGSDVGAARAAGARSILVPTQVTRAEEVWEADEVAADLAAAADRLVLRGSA